MKSAALLAAMAALAWGVSADAVAKGIRGLHSHSSPHSSPSSSHSSSHSSDGTPAHAGETHSSEGSFTGTVVRHAVARSRQSDNGTPAAAADETPEVRQQRDAAQAKLDAEILAARKLANAAAEEKRRLQAELAAIAAAEEQKRRDAEARARDREQAVQERKQQQIAWEGRCQIKAVMTDPEIATCRQVWTTPVH